MLPFWCVCFATLVATLYCRRTAARGARAANRSSMLRALSHIPWQVSAAAGWSALIAAPLLAEVWERESAEAAASHSSFASSIITTATVAQLRQEGFVVGPFTVRALWTRPVCALHSFTRVVAVDSHL